MVESKQEESEKMETTEKVVEIKSHGWGVRHIQMVCMFLTLTGLFIARSSMAVAVLAMTDVSRKNDSIVEIYDWDKKTQGYILSAFFFGYVIMQIPGGIITKRFGGKYILLVSLLVNGVICLAVPILANLGGWPLVFICRMSMGLAQACLFPASHTLLGRWLPDHERTGTAGLVYGGTQIGTIIGLPMSGYLAGTRLGWKLIFYSMSALMFLIAIIWHWFSASTPAAHRMMTVEERQYIEKGLNLSQEKRTIPIPWMHIFKTKAMWAILTAHIGSGFVYTFFFNEIPTYLEKGLQVSLKNSASMSALPYVGMLIGSIFSSRIAEIICNRNLVSVTACRKLFNSIGYYGTAVALIILSFLGPENQSLALVTLVVALTLMGFITAGFMVNFLDLSPNFAGLLLSLTNFISSMVSVMTPIITSFILNNEPTNVDRWHKTFLVVAAVACVSNTLYVILGSADRQDWDDPNFLDQQKADPEEMKPVLKKDDQETKQQET